MGWVHIEKTVHDCPTPKVHVAKKQGYTLGSIWCCDDCGQKWKLYFSRYGRQGTVFQRHGESVLIDASVKADATEPVSETDPKLSDCDHKKRNICLCDWGDDCAMNSEPDFTYCPKCGVKLEEND